jgi:hypothetical protein
MGRFELGPFLPLGRLVMGRFVCASVYRLRRAGSRAPRLTLIPKVEIEKYLDIRVREGHVCIRVSKENESFGQFQDE